MRARARGARPATRSPFSRHDGMHAAAGNQPVRLHACSSRGQYSGAHSVASRRAGDDKMGEDLCVCVCVCGRSHACMRVARGREEPLLYRSTPTVL